MNPVVAIAGPPGSGKTALMTALAGHLHSALLFMDAFEAPALSLSGGDLAGWLSAGARFDDFVIPGLSEALTALRAGQPATEPLSGRRIAPAPLVLFEMPLGRAWPPTAAMIDFLIWLDTPADIALARNVIAWEKETPPPPRAWLVQYMQDYLAQTRAALGAQAATVAPGADLRLDGSAPPDAMAAQVVATLRQRGLVE